MSGLSIDERFERFHRRNPHVYRHLVRLARQARSKGRRKIGIKMIWEVVRWSIWLETGEGPKLNNDYHSRYARLIARQEPDLAGMFSFREIGGIDHSGGGSGGHDVDLDDDDVDDDDDDPGNAAYRELMRAV